MLGSCEEGNRSKEQIKNKGKENPQALVAA
jgi:hypothetical protein